MRVKAAGGKAIHVETITSVWIDVGSGTVTVRDASGEENQLDVVCVNEAHAAQIEDMLGAELTLAYVPA